MEIISIARFFFLAMLLIFIAILIDFYRGGKYLHCFFLPRNGIDFYRDLIDFCRAGNINHREGLFSSQLKLIFFTIALIFAEMGIITTTRTLFSSQ